MDLEADEVCQLAIAQSITNIQEVKKKIKPDTLSQIAESLEVDVYELFKSNHTPNQTPKNNKKLINSLSKEMTRKIVQTMDDVFKRYQK